MSDEPTVLKGGCSCGAVRYEVRAKPNYVGICIAMIVAALLVAPIGMTFQ